MLELRHLHHFSALARRLNYARAAEDIGISQPALSRSIQALEAYLGLRLLDRDRGAVTLTPQGHEIIQRARTLLAEADDLSRHSRNVVEGVGGRVRFGITPMPARALLADTLSERIRAAPRVINDVTVRNEQAHWDALMSGDIEFFVSQQGLLAETEQAREEILGHFPLCLLVRAGHPLLETPGIDHCYPILRSSHIGLPLPGTIGNGPIGDQANRQCNIIEDFSALAAITAATDAIWFSCAPAAARELKAAVLHELPSPADVPRQEVGIVAYSHARRSLSPNATEMIRTLRKHVQRMARDTLPATAPSHAS